MNSIVDPLTGSNVNGVIAGTIDRDPLLNYFGGENLLFDLDLQTNTPSTIFSDVSLSDDSDDSDDSNDFFDYFRAVSAVNNAVDSVFNVVSSTFKAVDSVVLAIEVIEDLAEEDSEEDSEVELIEENLINENDLLESNNLIQNSLIDPFISGLTNIAENNSSQEYNSVYGYGLVDAAAALSSITGETVFPDVQDLGGNFWGLDAVNAPEVWAQGYTGKDTLVAVIDTGIDYTHVDLDNNIWLNENELPNNGIDDDGNGYVDDLYGWDFVDNDNIPLDLHGHGTHVAGTIAAENNSFGVTGVAYDAKIMTVRVFNQNGSATYADIADGIIYAVDNGADIINLSFGGGYSVSVEAAGEYAIEQGVAIVMSAGNNSALSPIYPARHAEDWGIAVGAIDKNGQKASFSNNAGITPLDYVVAPGVDILSTFPDDRYAYASGTSMAAPHVSGVAALALSANPNLVPAEIESLLIETADSAEL